MKPRWSVVLGCPRSGTTFLMRAIKTMPNTAGVAGHVFPPAVPHIVNSEISEEVRDALGAAFERALDKHARVVGPSRTAAVSEWLRREIGVDELSKALRKKRRLERVVFKEPFLAFAPQFTYEALPDCRIVHIVRNGLDSADSLQRSYEVLSDSELTDLSPVTHLMGRRYDERYCPWWVERGSEEEFFEGSPYVRSVWMWKEMVRRCHEFFSQPEIEASGRVLVLRYEDLMRDPIGWGKKVIEHIGGEMPTRVRKRLASAHTKSIDIHKKRSAEEIRQARAIAKDELDLYGYGEASSEYAVAGQAGLPVR